LSFLFWAAQKFRLLAFKLDRIAIERKFTMSEILDKSLDEYVTAFPHAQNAIDALPGWVMALPEFVGVTAGTGYFYNDNRIAWAIEQFGDIAGKKVLELGPLEASHTYMLSQAGAGHITSIEANKLAFFRCLVVKQLLNIQNSNFLLGDFQKFLEISDEKFDFVVASGVLYHMQDPIRLIELIAERSDSFYLWTHYANDEAMPLNDPRRAAFVGNVQTKQSHGVNIRLYERSYHGAWVNKSFCGGTHDLHRWIEREDMLALIKVLGFEDIQIMHDQPDHDNGPSFSIFARRTKTI
jgi:Methyltransferase domain